MPTQTVSLVTLGCSKNFVDSEQMAGLMQDAGLTLISDPSQADAIVVNTCAFIESAREEAIETILDLADYKDPSQGRCQHLIVTGCLGERYAQAIKDDLPEVDAILGTRSYYAIVEAIADLDRREDQEARIYHSTDKMDAIRHLDRVRRHSTGSFAYVKVAEGCRRGCAFCAIPSIRGTLISRPMASILEEARELVSQGAQELILIAQDTTSYGLDLYGEPRLAELMEQLAAIEGVRWVRALYLYADRFSDELLRVMRDNAKILPYIDLPIQHASDRVLKRMARPDTEASLRSLFQRIREAIPHAIIRTTVMVGFPGETDEDYQALLDFIKEVRFSHLGCFIFSPEEGTRAESFPDRVDPAVARSRYEGVMQLQQTISRKQQQQFVDETFDVLLEAISEDGLAYLGRTWFQAPEVDGHTLVYAREADIEVGKWYPVQVKEADDYGLTGFTVSDESQLCEGSVR